jgi:hypothetical protein
MEDIFMAESIPGARKENSADIIRGASQGTAPLKVVTGIQETSNLSFDIQPGAIVAHPNARVIFVCG